MPSSRVRLTVASFVCAVFLGTTAQAAMIGVNFIGDTHGTEIGLSTEAGVESQENWNDLKWWGDPHALINADGESTDITINIVTEKDAFSSHVLIPGLGDNLLMRGYYHGDGSAWSVTLSGLTSEYPSGGYDLIVYFDGANGKDKGDWVTEYALSSGESIYGKDAEDATDWDGAFDRAFGTSAATATVGNYVRFTGLTSSEFVLTATPTSGDAPINGIQIVAAPEPAALALLGLGLAATLARRRQTQPGRHRRRRRPPGL